MLIAVTSVTMNSTSINVVLDEVSSFGDVLVQRNNASARLITFVYFMYILMNR
jgi:hypothetical protein